MLRHSGDGGGRHSPDPWTLVPVQGPAAKLCLWGSWRVGRKEMERKRKAEQDGCIVRCRRETPGPQAPVSHAHQCGQVARQERHLSRVVRCPGLRSPGPSHAPGSSEREVPGTDAGVDCLVQGQVAALFHVQEEELV